MEKLERTNRAKAVREYLRGVGVELSSVQAHEVLARSLGYKNKHVLAAVEPRAGRAYSVPDSVTVEGQVVPVMALTGEPLGLAQMQALSWNLDLVVPFALDQLEDIDAMNDYASQRITGNEAALEDIRYDHVPELNFGKGWVAYRVSGHVSDPEAVFPELDFKQEFSFYQELLELAQVLRLQKRLNLALPGKPLASVNLCEVSEELLKLLEAYAVDPGAHNHVVNQRGAEPLAWCRPQGSDSGGTALLMADLKYATKIAPACWSLDIMGGIVELRFVD